MSTKITTSEHESLRLQVVSSTGVPAGIVNVPFPSLLGDPDAKVKGRPESKQPIGIAVMREKDGVET